MDPAKADIYRTVEYSRDKWTMNRVPLALLGCVIGIAYVVYLDPRPAGAGIIIAFLAISIVMVVSVGGGILFDLAFEGRTSLARLVGVLILAAILVPLIWYRPSAVFTPVYPRQPHVPAHVAGWAAIMISVGWIAFALFRHFKPARPVVTLSPTGIGYHSGLVKNLLISWQEIEFVGDMEITNATGYPHRYPEVPVVLVSKQFYEQHILVQRSLARGPRRSWDALLVPKGQSMQFVFHPWLFSLGPKDFREPIEARWKAFRDAPPADAKLAVQAPQVYGAWSIDGSLWQTISFVVPILSLIGILAYSTGIWPR